MSYGLAKSQSFVTRAKTFSSVAAGLVFLVGVLVLIGWLFDLERLKSGYGPIAMKANAALSLMLAAVSVWTLRASIPYQKLGQICAVGAGLIGFLTLSEHVTGLNLHIDQLLFAEATGALATTSPGRMGITASTCFVIYGVALLLLHRRRAVSFAQVLSIVAGFWAFLAIIGFAYQTQALFGISRYTGIALPTAVALSVLCLGIVAASINQGMLSVVSDETAAGIMTRRLVVVAVSVPFVMGWLRLAGQRAGYFDLGFGTALSVTVLTVIFLLAIWRAAIRLQEVEKRRLATEAVASEGEERWRRQAALIDLSYEPIFLWDLSSGITEWNKGCEQLYGYSEEKAIGRRSHELLRTEFPVSLENFQEALEREGSWSGELRHITKDGREVIVESRQQLIQSRSQRLVLETNRDITERKTREQQLAEQAHLLALTFDAIFVRDSAQRITYWSKGAEEAYGYTQAEALGKNPNELLRTALPEALEQITEQLMRDGRWIGEVVHTRKDGRKVIDSSRWALDRDADGNAISILETNNDVTAQKEAEADLRMQREWMRLTMHASRMGTWARELDTSGRVDWSPELEQLFGFATGEFPGTEEAFMELVHPEDRQTVHQAVADAIMNRTDYDVEFRYSTIDGRMGWMLGRGSAAYDAAGRPIRLAGLGWDITERKLAERAQALLAGIVESSEDAIVSKTLDGIIDSWNGAAERLFGYTAQEAIGKPITIIIPPERLDEERLILERLRKGERLDHFETVRMSKSGQPVDVSLTVSPIRNQHGVIIGASKIARDVTERRRAERERERLLLQERSLRAEAERIARLKDEFLATISHELRTPLNAILGWATILRKGAPNESTADHALEAIERNAKSQAQLIEDLLDVSRIIAGNLRIDFKPIALSSVVKAAMDSVQPAAEAKEIHLQIIVDPSADTVRGDSERLQQVIWNLLSNSIKFTPRGGRVDVKVERNGSDAQLTVTDTGEGISAEFLPFVFDRFKQADGSSTRKHGGLGLGLAISRHLTEMHGGTIEVDSKGEGLGSTFTIRLPLADVPAVDSINVAAGTEAPLARDGTRLDGIRLLIVDDHVDAREMLRVILEDYGADVTTASSTRDTLAVLTGLRPDVIVSDIGMPGEDGYDLIRKVRALSAEEGGTTLAIALTGYVRVEERMRALAAGYQMFVPKPVEVEELSAIITTLLRRGAG